MQEKLLGERRQLANQQNSQGLPSLLTVGSRLPGSKTSISKGEDQAVTSVQSAERISRARAQILLLVGDIGEVEASPASFFGVLPQVLREVQHLSVEEIIEVARGIEKSSSGGMSDGKSAARMVLLVLAAKEDPEEILADESLIADGEVRRAALNSIARRDPKRARQWLTRVNMPKSEKESFEALLFVQTLERDVDAAVALLRENPSLAQVSSGPTGTLPVVVGAQSKLVEAAANPENAEIKVAIASYVLRAATIQGGVPAARRQAEGMELAAEDLLAYFQMPPHQADPESLVSWMTEVLPPRHQLKTVPSLVRRWALRDFNAAGEWLGGMPPSTVKDESIQSFALAVAALDSRAAVVWAGEIQDEDMRRRAVERAISQWKIKDAEAADEWLKENGIEQTTSRNPTTPQ